MKGLSKKTSIILIVVATIFILFANFTFWLNRYIFDPQNFKEVTTKTIQEESSREALAEEIVDEALADNPILEEAIGERLEEVIANLLDSDVSETLFEKVALVIQKQITTSDQKDVSIDMTVIKGFLGSLSGVVSPDDPESLKVEDIPDELVIIEKDELPNISVFGDVVFWIAPWAFVLGILLFAYVIYAAMERSWVFKVCGLSLIIGSVIAIIMPYLLTPAIFASATSENLKIVLVNIYQGFAAKFLWQSLIVIIIGLIFLALGMGKVGQNKRLTKK